MRFIYFLVFFLGLYGLNSTDLPDIDPAISANITCALAVVAIISGLLGMCSKQSCDADSVMRTHIEKYHT